MLAFLFTFAVCFTTTPEMQKQRLLESNKALRTALNAISQETAVGQRWRSGQSTGIWKHDDCECAGTFSLEKRDIYEWRPKRIAFNMKDCYAPKQYYGLDICEKLENTRAMRLKAVGGGGTIIYAERSGPIQDGWISLTLSKPITKEYWGEWWICNESSTMGYGAAWLHSGKKDVDPLFRPLFRLAKENNGCWSPQGEDKRIYLGSKDKYACAMAARNNPNCGNGFSVDTGNNNWCGCGKKDTDNANCDKPDGTSYARTSNRYLLVECKDHEGTVYTKNGINYDCQKMKSHKATYYQAPHNKGNAACYEKIENVKGATPAPGLPSDVRFQDLCPKSFEPWCQTCADPK